ncbi:hypothetical protein KZP23_13855 [Echinicola marina]|uniref:hypothetical protein n=1 Tax=Echinicola marina TaxID=2859768 RepID=UPI001CF68360|nr:hypothetical protein [Echinicola marina]UCS91817.1 hypothetical protein KZP23_13855 [Echinicola marina]
MKLSLFIVLFLAVFFSACTDDDRPVLQVEAKIVDGGNPAVDGCGWLMEINGENYKPKSLKEQFQIDGLEVILFYSTTGVSYCGMGSNELTSIAVDKIYKK